MTPSTASELLARLAATHNAAPPAVPDPLPNDLTSAGSLFAIDESWLQPLASDVTALPYELATFAGHAGAAVTFADDLAALRAGLVRSAAARQPGRTQCLVVGDVDYHAAASNLVTVPMGDFEAAAATLARIASDCALLVVEPWLPEPAAAGALRALLAAARAHRVMTACDEERTAARVAATTVHAELRLDANWTVLGPSLAGGLPFAAVVGPVCGGTGRDAHPVAMAIAAAALRAGVGRVLAPELARLGAALREATARAAEREQLQVAWRGPAAMPRLQFLGQEGADGSLIEHHFGLELAAVGWQQRGPLLFGSRLRSGDHTALLTAFDRALARIRVKLVEYNSYLSGGIPYAWAGGDATLRARGVAVYRYPRLAAVRVTLAPGPGVRIDFAPGPLGDVTSSGFFLPTMFAGDVDVAARYVLHRWQSGPDSACLGLFLQNAQSSARYYAQVMSTSDRPCERTVAAGLAGVVHPRHAAPADIGWLRLQRRGGTLTALWRADGASLWTRLGECAATADPIFIGAKIWSKVANDGLVADIVDLQVQGEAAAAQEPLLGPVPDPRG